MQTTLDQNALSIQLKDMLRDCDVLAELSDDQIDQLVQQARFEQQNAGETLVSPDQPGDKLYFVLDGQIRLIGERNGQPHVVGYRFAGDFGGEVTSSGPHLQPTTEEAAVDSILAVFDDNTFLDLASTAPVVAQKLAAETASLLRKELYSFEGQRRNEIVATRVGRHFVAFLAKLPGPLILLIVGTASFLGLFYGLGLSQYFLILPACLVIVGLFLVLYLYLDWRNDDFILTSERAIHIERILLHGEMRDEAPLTSIQDVSVIVPGLLANIFDYSDLHIQTAGAGTIVFDGLKQADKLRDEIFQQRAKARERVEASDITTVRQKLRISVRAKSEAGPTNATARPQPKKLERRRPLKLQRFFKVVIPRVQEIEGERIIWRKNYFVYLRLVWLPLLTSLVLLYLTPAVLFGWFPFSESSLIWLAFLLLAWLVVLLWYSYQFDTWRKDEYQVTRTAIIDYKGSAFNLQGEEERVGTFDVIQNTTYFTPSFIAKLLNIGHVVIETAGTEATFTFKWVYNPSAVQQEIFKRWLSHKEAKVQRDRAYEERRFERWFGEFYDIIGPREAQDGDKANTEETRTSLD